MKSALEQEYYRNRSRIQHFIKRNEKRGYDFSNFDLGKIPEKITKKDAEKLKKLTPEKLYKKATVNEDTNISKADKGRYLEKGKKQKGDFQDAVKPKKRSKQKGDFQGAVNPPDDIDIVLRNVEQEIASFTPKPLWSESGRRSRKGKSLEDSKNDDKNRVNNILKGAISHLGRRQVAINLASHAEEVNSLIQEILYASGSKEGNFRDGRTQVNFSITRFAALCYGRALTVDESIAITEASEENES